MPLIITWENTCYVRLMIGKLILMFWKKVGKINQNSHYAIMNVIFIIMYFVTFSQTLIIFIKNRLDQNCRQSTHTTSPFLFSILENNRKDIFWSQKRLEKQMRTPRTNNKCYGTPERKHTESDWRRATSQNLQKIGMVLGYYKLRGSDYNGRLYISGEVITWETTQ